MTVMGEVSQWDIVYQIFSLFWGKFECATFNVLVCFRLRSTSDPLHLYKAVCRYVFLHLHRRINISLKVIDHDWKSFSLALQDSPQPLSPSDSKSPVCLNVLRGGRSILIFCFSITTKIWKRCASLLHHIPTFSSSSKYVGVFSSMDLLKACSLYVMFWHYLCIHSIYNGAELTVSHSLAGVVNFVNRILTSVCSFLNNLYAAIKVVCIT